MTDNVATTKKTYRAAKAKMDQLQERARQLADHRVQVETNIAAADAAQREARAAYDAALEHAAAGVAAVDLAGPRSALREAEDLAQAQRDLLDRVKADAAGLDLGAAGQAVYDARQAVFIALRDRRMAKIAQVGDDLIAAALAQHAGVNVRGGSFEHLVGSVAVGALGQTWGKAWAERLQRIKAQLDAEVDG